MDANKAISETKQLLHILRKLTMDEATTLIMTLSPNTPHVQTYEEDHDEWITIELRDGSLTTFVYDTELKHLERIIATGNCDGCDVEVICKLPDINIKWPESWKRRD